MNTDDAAVMRFERPADRERLAQLDRLAHILQTTAPDLDVRYELIDPYHATWTGPREPLLGLVVQSPHTTGHAQVLATRFKPHYDVLRHGSYGMEILVLVGDVDHALQNDQMAQGYEMVILQEPWSGTGHLRESPVEWLRSEAPDTVATALVRWSLFEREYEVALPIVSSTTRLKRLRAVAASKLASRQDAQLAEAVDGEIRAQLDPGGRHRLGEDLARASATRVWWHFPRDVSGRLQLKTIVLLECYDAPTPRSPKGTWLAAAGPERRSDPQRIELRLEQVVGEYYEHRWDRDRWMWDDEVADAPAAERWRLGDDERAARCVEMMEDGDLPGALDLFGVHATAHIQQLLRGKPLSYQLRDLTPKWTVRAHEEIGRSAPWLFASSLERDEDERRRAGLKSPRRSIRLFGLKGVTQVRKPAVFLTQTTVPELQLEWSATTVKLRETDWVRPVDFDLVQHGLIQPFQIPGIR